MDEKAQAPGLRIRKRANGDSASYWCARADLVRKGYRPSVVPLTGLPLDMAYMRCRQLQAEMLAWAHDDSPGGGRNAYGGTLASLVRYYLTDADSPFRELRPISQRAYRAQLEGWAEHHGTRRLSEVTGSDVKRWYLEMIAGGVSVSTAHLRVNILKAALAFGSSKRIAECTLLRNELRDTRFKNGEARTNRMTYAQLCQFRDAAHAMGRHSMAMGVSIQFAFALRPRDVIGEWQTMSEVPIRTLPDRKESMAQAVSPRGPRGLDSDPQNGIRHHGKIWRDGLTWRDLATGTLTRKTSKTGAVVVHRVADYPDLMQELSRAGAERVLGASNDGPRRPPAMPHVPNSGFDSRDGSQHHIGPLVISEITGMPYTSQGYRNAFRMIARKAGLPDSLWNADCRSGAVTEAYESGATTEGAMALAGHNEQATSRRYLRDTGEQTSRVAALRVRSRGE